MGPSAKLPPSPIFCFTPMFRGSPNGLPRFRSHPARSEVHRTGETEVLVQRYSGCGQRETDKFAVSDVVLAVQIRGHARQCQRAAGGVEGEVGVVGGIRGSSAAQAGSEPGSGARRI